MSSPILFLHQHGNPRSTQNWNLPFTKSPHLTLNLLASCMRPLRVGFSPLRQSLYVPVVILCFFALFWVYSKNTQLQPACTSSISDTSIHSSHTIIFHLKCKKTNQSSLRQLIFLHIQVHVSRVLTENKKMQLTNRTSSQDPPFISETHGHLCTSESDLEYPHAILRAFGNCLPQFKNS